ncbi:glucosaminidase [Vibrio albus]|uniref:Glucosaminidase n=1 Tax=Vibrio albus TaxID=2200953 RepID=A0A2U3BBG6_9VIBR|nr:glucosaminidase domain-containing protein [Vibrio albus]PWI34136.1 glucosaminidase [Vibrio albus]
MHKVVAKLFENVFIKIIASGKKIKFNVGLAAFLSVALVSCVYNAYKPDSGEAELVAFDLVELEPTPDFTSISDVTEKKKAFFEYLRPGIRAENQRVNNERRFLSAIQSRVSHNKSLSSAQQQSVAALADSYQLPLQGQAVTQDWLDEMNTRVNVLPETLVLTQAANESAWGTSRFARKGNNYFGQWCYQKGCGLVPLQRHDEATHEVAKFDSAAESIHRYFMNVNRNQAYEELRAIRGELSRQGVDLLDAESATKLANGLLKYSERGQEYVNDLQAMIRHNEEFWKQ